MISETVQLRLMTYFFDQVTSEPFNIQLEGALIDAMYQGEEMPSEDELVQIGVELINQYLNTLE